MFCFLGLPYLVYSFISSGSWAIYTVECEWMTLIWAYVCNLSYIVSNSLEFMPKTVLCYPWQWLSLSMIVNIAIPMVMNDISFSFLLQFTQCLTILNTFHLLNSYLILLEAISRHPFCFWDSVLLCCLNIFPMIISWCVIVSVCLF